MQRFEPSEWKRRPHDADLRHTVDGLLRQKRSRTALDEVLRRLRHDRENTDALSVALTILAHSSRTALLTSPEPPTDMQRWSALLAPIMTECSACHEGWYSSHTHLSIDHGMHLNVASPMGLQCQNCRYTLCRDCLKVQRPTSYMAPVDRHEEIVGFCTNSNCGRRQLDVLVLPTGRHDVTPLDPDAIEGVIVTRSGPIRPAADEALTVVMKFLPLIADDAPLLHIRKAAPGMMSDASARDRLAQSLILDLERKGVLAPGAWVRSERMFILPGAAQTTNYLITTVLKSDPRTSPAASHAASRPSTYTYLLQVLPRRGSWATLRDPRTGDFHDGTFGAVSASAEVLPGIAQEVIKRFARMGISRRVMFFEGDCTQQGELSTDDVCGIVTEGGAALLPYSEGST